MGKAMTCSPSLPSLFLLSTFVLCIEPVIGDGRAQVIKLTCGKQWQQNSTVSVPNFVSTMETVREAMQNVGYGEAHSGTGPDSNYGFGQCYGDLSLVDCIVCYAEARTYFPRCFPHNGARLYLDGCFLRSENYSFYSEYTGADDRTVCGNATQKSLPFQTSARTAVLKAVKAAPNNNGYGRAVVAVPKAANDSAYVLADCWKTLNATSCRACLELASMSMLKCLPWSEGRALYTGCFMRYSDVNFLNPVPGNGKSLDKKVVIIVVVCSVAVVFAGLGTVLYIWRQRKLENNRRGKNDPAKLTKILRDSSLYFKYSTLDKATGSFAIGNKLGQGGFGTVYKGVLADGREIAVKRLFFNNKNGAADFYNEVNIISSVQHRNLTRLLGCSCSGPESLLVYEFLPNRSLSDFIFDPDKGKKLDWYMRYRVIIGAAEGLAYLHGNPITKIIHRDIKASNILLDSRFRAKIADFGLVRSFEGDKSHITTGIAGTLGYMAPEYLTNGQLTEKADVYSFGVLLLEIVTGRPNNGDQASEFAESLVIAVWNKFQQQSVEELIDLNILAHTNRDENIKNEILRLVHIGLLCTQESSSLRPTMARVVKMLTREEEELIPPTSPPFVDEENMTLNDAAEDPCYPLNATSSSHASITVSSIYPR